MINTCFSISVKIKLCKKNKNRSKPISIHYPITIQNQTLKNNGREANCSWKVRTARYLSIKSIVILLEMHEGQCATGILILNISRVLISCTRLHGWILTEFILFLKIKTDTLYIYNEKSNKIWKSGEYNMKTIKYKLYVLI